MSTFNRSARAVVLGLFALFLCHPGVLGQGNGAITGKISDTTGAVIPGAEVTITHVATAKARTVLSSSSGTFRVTNLIPGEYLASHVPCMITQ